MYELTTNLKTVAGVGEVTAAAFAKHNIHTVLDLLLTLPLRHQDFAQITTIANAPLNTNLTLEVQILQASSRRVGKRSHQTVLVGDGTGQLKLHWFNLPYITQQLKIGDSYYVSGQIKQKGSMVHPQIEKAGRRSVHTGRLVPQYSTSLKIKQGTLRRLLDNIIHNINWPPDPIANNNPTQNYATIATALANVHFPTSNEAVEQAWQRLALQELIELITRSQYIKNQWQNQQSGLQMSPQPIPQLPFSLSPSQTAAIQDIITDLNKPHPMNRLLMGDVGAGKTAIAALAAQQVIDNHQNAVLLVPTKVLAQQHTNSIQQLLPNLSIVEVTGQKKLNLKKVPTTPSLYVGTHGLLNHLDIIKPALVVYDEQHRFGVAQRTLPSNLTHTPHLLTMTATPIPRSYLLSIFAHLSVSKIELRPEAKRQVKTWLVEPNKRLSAYNWVEKYLQEHPTELAIFVSPIIGKVDQPDHAAVNLFQDLSKKFSSNLPTGLLHGKLSSAQQQDIIKQLYGGEIRALVATPIVEVGINLPTASIIVIEGAERFGLASLHQLRGRVGRQGQEAYCLLVTDSNSSVTKDRLQRFSQLDDGEKIAELDLQNRGGGDIFAYSQHGLDTLRFADWTNLNLISQAQSIVKQTVQLPFYLFHSPTEEKEELVVGKN